MLHLHGFAVCKGRHWWSVARGCNNHRSSSIGIGNNLCFWACKGHVCWVVESNDLCLNPFKTSSMFCIVHVCKMILLCLARTRIFDFPGEGEVTYVKVCDWRQYALCALSSILYIKWSDYKLVEALATCVYSVSVRNCAYGRTTYPFVLSKEGVVRFCELKILKLGPSCVYHLCSGLGRIRTYYFAGKSNFAS